MFRERWLAITALICCFDQISKYWCDHHLNLFQTLPMVPGIDLTLRYNTGAAFSLLADAAGWQRGFFIGLGLVVCTIIYYWLGRLTRYEKQEGLALSLILGGALGNLMDRIYYGYVIDFIRIYYKAWEWPAFNVADSAICIGALLLIPFLFQNPHRPQH